MNLDDLNRHFVEKLSLKRNYAFSPVRSSRSAGMSRIRISRWHAVFGHRRGTVFRRKTLRDRCAIFVRDAGDRCAVLETRMSTLRLGAIVPANLNHALEVDVHAVRELEGLEVGEANNGRARAKVLDLLEPIEETVSLFFLNFLSWKSHQFSLTHVYIIYKKRIILYTIHFLYYYLFYTFILYFNIIIMYRSISYILYYDE